MAIPNRPEAGNMQMTNEQITELAEPFWLKDAQKEGEFFDANGFARALLSASKPAVTEGWKLVPVEPTETMVVDGFESWPSAIFSNPKDWGAFESMSGCQQAAHKARLCYAAMLAASPAAPAQSGETVAQWQSRVILDGGRRDQWINIDVEGAETLLRDYQDKYEVRALYTAPQPSPTAVVLDDARLGCFVRKLVEQLSDSPKSFLANVQRAIADLNTDQAAVALDDERAVLTPVGDGWLDDHITNNVKFMRGEMLGVYYSQGWQDAERHHIKQAEKDAERRLVYGTRAASPQPAVCATCNGHGMIGGPSYYAPDEGGEPCPDCNIAQPVEQTRALTEDAGDAARYRLLRRGQHWSVINGIGDTLRGEDLDDAIDAAMIAARPASGETE
jgi:hypothetical protein